MASPTDRRYTQTHEWVKEGSGGTRATFGITQHNLSQLGTVSNVSNLPSTGTDITQNANIGTITGTSSTQTVTFHAPVGGSVERNERLLDDINADPYGSSSWLVEVSSYDKNQYNALMTGPQYDNFISGGS